MGFEGECDECKDGYFIYNKKSCIDKIINCEI